MHQSSIRLGTTPAGHCEGCDVVVELDRLRVGLCADCRDAAALADARDEVKRLRSALTRIAGQGTGHYEYGSGHAVCMGDTGERWVHWAEIARLALEDGAA